MQKQNQTLRTIRRFAALPLAGLTRAGPRVRMTAHHSLAAGEGRRPKFPTLPS